MEYVGRRVKKEFSGQGTLFGSVQAHETPGGVFTVVYDDGSSEDLNLEEVLSLLVPSEASPLPASGSAVRESGSSPNKRRCIGNEGTDNDNFVIESGIRYNLVARDGNSMEFDLNLNKGLDLNEGLNTLTDDDGGASSVGLGASLGDLDLNAVVNLETDEGFDLRNGGVEDDTVEDDARKKEIVGLRTGGVEGDSGKKEIVDLRTGGLEGDSGKKEIVDLRTGGLEGDSGKKEIVDLKNGGVEGDAGKKEIIDLRNGGVEGDAGKKKIIDLNLDVNEGLQKLSEGRVRRGFDLNLKFPEDEVVNMEARDGQFASTVSVEARAQMSVDLVKDNNSGMLSNMKNESEGVNVEIKELAPSENCAMEFGGEDLTPLNSQMKRRGRKRSEEATKDIEAVPASPEMVQASVETDRMCLEMENIKEAMLPNGTDNDNDILGAITRGRRGRKRKEQQGNDFTLSTPETGLRRSSRRAKMAAVTGPNQIPNAEEIDGINQHLFSPAISAVSDEKLMAPAHGISQDHVLPPPKVELPPSSCDLDLDGASMFSVVSVYSFLRSFSTLLFLSPFEPGDFVMSIKSNDSTLLLDSIHVSLLRALRKHMESLSEEGSVTATNCLRSLNWDFLDLVTWPMFVVEYFLLHSPGHVPDFNAYQMKFFYEEYYKLAASAKIEILQHLCDDVIEVDAFRTELIKRALATDRQTDLDRSAKQDSLKKRKYGFDAASNSCITEEDAEDPLDWNSDECSLCKMDGNLICCDGCPAAFHSRCVGVVSSELPEGEWYCPECIIGKDKPCLKVGKLVRGAELLGIDPYQRAFYSCCGYLVVVDTCDDKISWSYTVDDLPTLIEALESAPVTYGIIINSICKQWNIVRGGGARNDLDARSSSIQSAFPRKSQIPEMHMSPIETLNKNEAFVEKRSVAKFMVLTNSSAEPENAKMDNHLASSEGSAEVSQTFAQVDTSKEMGLSCSKRHTEMSDHCSNAGKLADTGDQCIVLTSVNVEKGKNISSESCGYVPDAIYSSQVISQVYHVNYVNSYEFARVASSFYEEWSSKSSDKMSEGVAKASDEIIARQLKIVSNKIADFSWANIQKSNMNLIKERCGWCIYCRIPEEEKDCLFIMNCSFPAVENYAWEVLGIQSRKNIKNHLVDVICHIICIEDHLQGLLLGPWLNQHYSTLWRTGLLGVADMTSLKEFLLKLEMNLHDRAFSADWQKHMDTVSSMGSACHIVKSSSRFSSKHGIGRKRANPSKVETSQSSNALTGLTLLWWRGGKGSRMLFNWKGLPHCLVSKAARQGGCKKIRGILYPEVGENAKRTKSASWRAAVERSRSVHQLALQVRELNANIKWDDIGNTNLKMDKDSKKPARSFKKVIIRRKSSEGGTVKYLLDFGKRRFIPDVVVRHGLIVEDSSSVRKKYWLEESHVPLHLLKSFEEKRIARKSNLVHSGKLRESAGMMRKPFKREGFSYLFSRAERAENYQCEHCKKDVPIREAVSCQHCKGFFHRRHVQKSAGSIAAECTYTCHKCPSEEFVKVDGKKRKSEPTEDKSISKRVKSFNQGKGKGRGRPKGSGKGKGKKSANSKKTAKVPVGVPLRRSARNAARIAKRSLLSIKAKGRKRGRKPKIVKDTSKIPASISLKKKRAPVNSSFWLNGLWLSRNPGDVRVTDFRSKMLLVLPREVMHDNPRCSLCGEMDHKSELIYVACETCRAWFHGDALNITADSVNNVIGYKCYECLKKRRPVCPHHGLSGSSESGDLSKSNTNVECTGNDSNCLTHIEDKPADQRSDSNDEAKDSVMTLNMEELNESDHREKD